MRVRMGRLTPHTGDFTGGCSCCAGKEQWVWQVVQALLDVAAYPDIDTAGMCFNFWHRLSRMLTSGFHEPSPSALQFPPAPLPVVLSSLVLPQAYTPLSLAGCRAIRAQELAA